MNSHLISYRKYQRLLFSIVGLYQQLLEGLQFIHQQNIIHRDLKPENIMFKEENNYDTLKIVDFGLATSTLVKEYSFPKCGTPGYVAPEVANLQDLTFKYDNKCDVFSLGCIFYKLLKVYLTKQNRITRKDLFPGTDYQQILKNNKKCVINLQYLAIFKTPEAAMDLISQMLKVLPNERISVEDALNHPFISGLTESPFSLKKNKFIQKGQKASTEDFSQEQSNPMVLNFNDCVKKETTLSIQNDCDIIEDEGQSLPQVPIMKQRKNQNNVGSLIMKGGNNAITKPPIQKSHTQDFDVGSPSPICSHRPSLLGNNQLDRPSPGLVSPGQLKSPGMMKSKFYEQKNQIEENADGEESLKKIQ